MKVHFGGRLFLVAAVLSAAAVFAVGLLVALGGRSVVAGPDAAPPAAAPTPVGHEWSQVEGHGTGTGLWWLGTTVNQALELRVNNARALRLEPNATSPSVIGGYSGNSVTTGAVGAAICGGGSSGFTNRVTDDYGTVGGGGNNQAGDNAGTTADRQYATVGGGDSNTASGWNATVGGGTSSIASGDYATVAGGVSNSASDHSATVGGGYANIASFEGATVGGGKANTASGGAATVPGGRFNIASGGSATVGGGDHNHASADYATVGGGYSSTASGYAATVGGGGGNTASSTAATVGGGGENTASGQFATVGGGLGNEAAAAFATVSGGGESTPGDTNTRNRVTDDYGTIGGGGNNQAGDNVGTTGDAAFNTVGGGEGNVASASFWDEVEWWGHATIGGGYSNVASGFAATIGGGYNNDAIHDYATVPGGADNIANGQFSTVPGGRSNTAEGHYSFAAGRRAKANNSGCFVWGDSTDADVACDSDNGFVVRASGNIWFGTTSSPDLSTGFINTSTGAYLSSAGVWTDNSDRDAKENFTPVDGQEVLASLAEMPITTWNYKAQDGDIRHMGPVGQDFYAAFGLGEDESHIAALDSSGVALAAIQGLYQLSQEQAARIQALEADNVSLQQRLDDLEARVTALEGGASTSSVEKSAKFPSRSY